MWWSRGLHLTGEALLGRARELGVNTAGDAPLDVTLSLPEPPLAPEHEIQRRVLDAERHLRDSLLFWVALGAAILTAIVGIGSLLATIRNGNQQIENARQQTENAKRLLSVQLAREFRDGFDSKEMQRRRVATAAALLRGADPPTDAVLAFFETVGHYVRQGALDRETMGNDFSYTITHYWPAVKAYVAHARTGRDGDPEHWANFEWLNGELLKEAARRRHLTDGGLAKPNTDAVHEFLLDEANLLKPPKPAKPPPAKPRLTHG
jgi:hypothetical protein